jgi:hypothetical protein
MIRRSFSLETVTLRDVRGGLSPVIVKRALPVSADALEPVIGGLSL